MKFVDFRCDWCGNEWEAFEPTGEKLGDDVTCTVIGCQRPARKLIGAPAVTGTRLYGKVGLARESNARQIEKELDSKGSWIPTPKEAKVIHDMTEAGVDPVIINSAPDPKRIEKALDTAMQQMAQGKIPT